MGAIFYFSSQLHPNVPGIDFTPLRKSLHVAEYMLLFALWCNAIYRTWPRRLPATLGWALAATVAYAASDELHQHFVGRDGNIFDVMIDSSVPFLIWLTIEVRQKMAHPRHLPSQR